MVAMAQVLALDNKSHAGNEEWAKHSIQSGFTKESVT